MEFHPKDLPISKTYDLKNEEDAVKAIEDMVQLGFKEKKRRLQSVNAKRN